MQIGTEEIKITILLGTFLGLFFAIIIVFLITIFKKKNQLYQKEKEIMQQAFAQQLLQSQIETQEETMSILGKELHDNVAQLLSSTKMLIGVTERGMQNPPDTLIIAEETLSQAINELRSLSKSLTKEWLEQFNFIENLTAEATRINASQKIAVLFNHPNKLPLEADKQTILFRIVQEAIQNAIKHAKASSIKISVEVIGEILEIIIRDNGEGFNITSSKNGMGIMNIKNRTHLLNGQVNWLSDNNGTQILIKLPVKIEENYA